MGNIFVTLFAQMSWVTYVLLAVGLILVIIEFFVPGYGVFGGIGIAALVAGIISRVVAQGLSVDQICGYIGILVLIIIGILLLVFSILSLSLDKGNGKFIFGNKNKEFNLLKEKNAELKTLVGKNGVAITDLNPGGKVMIDGLGFDAISLNEFLYANTPVTVKKINHGKVCVEKFKQ